MKKIIGFLILISSFTVSAQSKIFHHFLSGNAYPNYSTLLFGSTLASSPANFSITSEFAFSGGALQSTGTATNTGWDSFATFSYLSSQERQMSEVFFQVNNLTSSFRVVKYNTNGWAKAGSVCEIDFENSLVKLWGGYQYPTIPPLGVIQQTAMTVTRNVAHSYKVQFRKEDLYTKIILTNITTGESQTMSKSFSPGGSLTEGVFRGQVALMHVKGSFSFSELNYYALSPASPKIGIYGDSYVDGYSLSTDLQSRWAYRAANHEKRNAIVSGWGGNTSSDLVTRSKDYQNVTPVNVILSVGYNDTSYATWLSSLQSLINTFESKGSNVILCTYAPVTCSASAFISTMNAYVLASGYPVFDIAALLTVGGDRVTINSSLILPDLAHPTVAGHDLIYNAYLALPLNTVLRTIPQGLTSYFKFDANANDMKNVNNGSLNGSPSSVSGKINNGYSLNGTTQYIRFSDTNSLSFGNAGTDTPFSFNCWINLTSLAATNYMISKRESSLEYQFNVNATTGTISLVLFSAGAGSITLAGRSQGTVPTGGWRMVTASYDGSKTFAGLKIYINGVLQTLDNTSASSPYAGMNNTSSPANIGGLTGGAGAFAGIIDEFGIWSRVLSQAEITSLYNGGSGLAYNAFN